MIDRNIICSLKQEQKRLESILKQVEKDLSRAPEGNVLVRRYKKTVQFFYRNDPKDRNGVYMPAAERERAIALIQKSYEKKVFTIAKEQWKILDSFLKRYDPDALTSVFEKERELRQKYLHAFELPDEQFLLAWEAVEYEGKPFSENVPDHYTQKKERVRSKSEVLIANELLRAKLPYRYECPLKLDDRIIYPDFTILRMRDRREIYWDHLGMIDDTEYRNNALQRIRMYETNGIFLGDQLIISFETYRLPMNAVVIQQAISHYLV